MKPLALLAALLVASCATSPQRDVAWLHGKWAPPPGATEGLPDLCRKIAIVITQDNRLITASGWLVYETAINIVPKDGGFEISQRFLKHNGAPNCQGRTADYVAEHLAPTVFVEPIGEQMRYHILRKGFAEPMLMERIGAQQGVPADRPRPAGSGGG